MAVHASDLIKDLNNVPNIVGGLGLSIAAAQKAFDVEFLDSIERILAMAKQVLGGDFKNPDGTVNQAAIDFLQNMILKLAPSRYQYTETTLSVRMDLAQSLRVAGSIGLGFGIGAIAINAAVTLGYAYDYRAAAECKTVIHAYSLDPTVFTTLLTRAATLDDKSLELPPRSEVDQTLYDKNAAILKKTTGKDAKAITTPVPEITAFTPETAKPDTVVKVTGKNFFPAATVTLTDSGNKVKDKIAISHVTATSFEFTLPKDTAAGVAKVIVVDEDGTKSDPPKDFTVQAA